MHVLRSYFEELITSAQNDNSLSIDPLTKIYVVNLLCDYARIENIDAGNIPTLVSLYSEAVNSTGTVKSNSYRKLGDIALFLSGFYSQYVEISGGLSYYIDMGISAYQQAYYLTNNNVLQNLSNDFCSVIVLLNDASCLTSIGAKLTLTQLLDIHEKSPSIISWKKLSRLRAAPILQSVIE